MKIGVIDYQSPHFIEGVDGHSSRDGLVNLMVNGEPRIISFPHGANAYDTIPKIYQRIVEEVGIHPTSARISLKHSRQNDQNPVATFYVSDGASGFSGEASGRDTIESAVLALVLALNEMCISISHSHGV